MRTTQHTRAKMAPIKRAPSLPRRRRWPSLTGANMTERQPRARCGSESELTPLTVSSAMQDQLPSGVTCRFLTRRISVIELLSWGCGNLAGTVTVAALPLAAAAAGAGVVAAAAGVLLRVGRHQLGGGPVRAEQAGHGFHGLADVAEEVLVAGAQVVLAGLAVGGGGEPVFGAAAVAGEPHVAVPAVPREGVVLVLPELALGG